MAAVGCVGCLVFTIFVAGEVRSPVWFRVASILFSHRLLSCHVLSLWARRFEHMETTDSQAFCGGLFCSEMDGFCMFLHSSLWTKYLCVSIQPVGVSMSLSGSQRPLGMSVPRLPRPEHLHESGVA